MIWDNIMTSPYWISLNWFHNWLSSVMMQWLVTVEMSQFIVKSRSLKKKCCHFDIFVTDCKLSKWQISPQLKTKISVVLGVSVHSSQWPCRHDLLYIYGPSPISPHYNPGRTQDLKLRMAQVDRKIWKAGGIARIYSKRDYHILYYDIYIYVFTSKNIYTARTSVQIHGTANVWLW